MLYSNFTFSATVMQSIDGSAQQCSATAPTIAEIALLAEMHFWQMCRCPDENYMCQKDAAHIDIAQYASDLTRPALCVCNLKHLMALLARMTANNNGLCLIRRWHACLFACQHCC